MTLTQTFVPGAAAMATLLSIAFLCVYAVSL